MKYIIDNKEYEVVVTRKNNKNTYIRVKEDMKIYVSTNYFVTKRQVIHILNRNIDYLRTIVGKLERKLEKHNFFYYLGHKYDIIILSGSDVLVMDSMIYVDSFDVLQKWYKKQAMILFQQRLDFIYSRFEESIPYPKLRVRKMKTRWGVCNRKNTTVTLNLDLLQYDISKVDYVIVHELSHFVHFNHSASFWDVVHKYCPEYKQIKKALKDE